MKPQGETGLNKSHLESTNEAIIPIVQVHWVTKCPLNFPAGSNWYGDHLYGPGRALKWIKRLMPVHDTRLPESARGTEDQPEVDIGRASELECQINPSTDRPFNTPKHPQQPPRV